MVVIEKLPIPALAVGEGPHWDGKTETLFLVDITPGKVYNYNPKTGKYVSLDLGPEPVSLIIPVAGEKNKYIITLKNELKILTWDINSNEPHSVENLAKVEGDKLADRLNDGKCDPRGRLWTGSMGPYDEVKQEFLEGVGALYSYESSKGLKEHLKGIDLSNGLAWNEELNKFYYIDSLKYRVVQFDYNADTGVIANQQTVYDFKKTNTAGIPDGMTIDTEGKLWVACFNGGKVLRINPETGELLFTLEFPSFQITSAAFGGTNLDELYVTSANVNVDEEAKTKYPDCGCTFKVTGLNVKGLPMTELKK